MTPEQPSGGGRATNLVGVKFEETGRVYRYDAGHLALHSGDQVIVEGEHGHALGTVITLPQGASTAVPAGVRRVIKRADTGDMDKDDRNRARGRDALRICFQRVRERGLAMKLIKADAAVDGGKITFYFAAQDRIDFRDLVRELAHILHLRVEMKQVGAREEAKLIGAVGPCGRELCCSTWLHNPGGVSVKMAKAQGLSPNPSKLAGMCGRLKCCLRYEYDTYVELGRELPAIGTHVVSVKGDGVVTRQNVLKRTVMIRRDEGGDAEASLEDLVEQKPQ